VVEMRLCLQLKRDVRVVPGRIENGREEERFFGITKHYFWNRRYMRELSCLLSVVSAKSRFSLTEQVGHIDSRMQQPSYVPLMSRVDSCVCENLSSYLPEDNAGVEVRGKYTIETSCPLTLEELPVIYLGAAVALDDSVEITLELHSASSLLTVVWMRRCMLEDAAGPLPVLML